jgi:hypothetical protein
MQELFSHLKTRNRLQQYIRHVGAHFALTPMTFARLVPILGKRPVTAFHVIGFFPAKV